LRTVFKKEFAPMRMCVIQHNNDACRGLVICIGLAIFKTARILRT